MHVWIVPVNCTNIIYSNVSIRRVDGTRKKPNSSQWESKCPEIIIINSFLVSSKNIGGTPDKRIFNESQRKKCTWKYYVKVSDCKKEGIIILFAHSGPCRLDVLERTKSVVYLHRWKEKTERIFHVNQTWKICQVFFLCANFSVPLLP